MNVLDKIDPYLTSEDGVARSFALEAVSTYPETKPEWPVRLMNEILKNPKETVEQSAAIQNMTLTGEVVPLLVQAMEDDNEIYRLMLKRIAEALPLEVKLANREGLHSVFTTEEWSFFTDLDEGNEELLELLLEHKLLTMEMQSGYDRLLFSEAKAIAHRQAELGLIDPEALRSVIETQKNQQYIDFNGIITVYKIGLIKEESLIDDIAGMLLRDDEDILVEEVKDALAGFQSDQVAEVVEPLVKGRFPIFQLDVIGETHTESAVPALKLLYHKVDGLDLKSVIVKWLCERLAPDGRPEIEDFMTHVHDYDGIFEMEELAYGYFRIMGYDHPNLDDWREKAIGDIEQSRDISSLPLDLLDPAPRKPAVSEKIGRNEPCPCGSGKKYKKCHGK